MVVFYLVVTKINCCRVTSCSFLRYMENGIAKISIYSTEHLDRYFLHKNVEDVVLNDNPLMTAIFACTLLRTVTLTLILNKIRFIQPKRETAEPQVIMFYNLSHNRKHHCQ